MERIAGVDCGTSGVFNADNFGIPGGIGTNVSEDNIGGRCVEGRMERILLRSVLVTVRINIRQRKFAKDEKMINKFNQTFGIGVSI